MPPKLGEAASVAIVAKITKKKCVGEQIIKLRHSKTKATETHEKKKYAVRLEAFLIAAHALLLEFPGRMCTVSLL